MPGRIRIPALSTTGATRQTGVEVEKLVTLAHVRETAPPPDGAGSGKMTGDGLFAATDLPLHGEVIPHRGSEAQIAALRELARRKMQLDREIADRQRAISHVYDCVRQLGWDIGLFRKALARLSMSKNKLATLEEREAQLEELVAALLPLRPELAPPDDSSASS